MKVNMKSQREIEAEINRLHKSVENLISKNAFPNEMEKLALEETINQVKIQIEVLRWVLGVK